MSISFTPTQMVAVLFCERLNGPSIDYPVHSHPRYDEFYGDVVLISRAYGRFSKEFENYRKSVVKNGLLKAVREYHVLLVDAIQAFVDVYGDLIFFEDVETLDLDQWTT